MARRGDLDSNGRDAALHHGLRGPGSIDLAHSTITDSVAPPPLPFIDTHIGRFRILEGIGSGGMGEVFRAHDPQLGRDVALKVLRRLSDPVAQARFRREAQAMAALSHPNVLPIYDVGEVSMGHGLRLSFLAMELVQGQTLRTYLRARSPSEGERLRIFIAAGRGLHAAHLAGLVHRDFKPSNVLIGHEGRVRVMDFGLARVSDGSEESLRGADDWVPYADVTYSGSVFGTPPYMSPEQHKGDAVDERGDQYSFCVALWEAVYGERPFHGSCPRDLLASKLHGPPPMPAGPRRSLALHRALRRGLSPRPDDRFASMVELLAVLGREQERRAHWWRRVGGVTMVLTLGLIGLGDIGGVSSPLCQGASERLVGVWDRDSRARVQGAFNDTKLAYAEDTWRRVSGLLDDYARRWTSAHTEACAATRIEHTQPEPVLEGRMRCLDERLSHMSALVQTLATADADVVWRATWAARQLPALDACAEAQLLQAQLPLPDDPLLRSLARGIQMELARAKALHDAGRYDAGLQLVAQAQQQVKALGGGDLAIGVALRRGQLEHQAGDYPQAVQSLTQAYFEATRSGLDAVQAAAAVELVFILGYRQSRHQEALAWADHAQAAVERLGDERLRASLYRSLGSVHRSQRQLDEALAAHRRALSILEDILGPDHPEIAPELAAIGLTLYNKRKYAEALAAFDHALAITEAAYGSMHPEAADHLNNIGMVSTSQGEYERALGALGRAKTIIQETLDPMHPYHAFLLNNLGRVHARRGEVERASALYRRALPIAQEALGAVHPYTNEILLALGELRLSAADPLAAIELFEQALPICERSDAPFGDCARARFALARALIRARRREQHALELAERAREELAAATGEHASRLAEIERWLAHQETLR